MCSVPKKADNSNWRVTASRLAISSAARPLSLAMREAARSGGLTKTASLTYSGTVRRYARRCNIVEPRLTQCRPIPDLPTQYSQPALAGSALLASRFLVRYHLRLRSALCLPECLTHLGDCNPANAQADWVLDGISSNDTPPVCDEAFTAQCI